MNNWPKSGVDNQDLFRDFIRKLRGKPRRGDGIGRPQAHLGAALCLIRLRRFDEAVPEEEHARAGNLSDKDERLLCEAWLHANPDRVLHVPCDDTGSPADVDTEADLAQLRADVGSLRR